MSEQDNGLQLAVNNLATEMRRANYLNAIGIGGGNTKRPTLYQEFGYPRTITFNDFYNMYRRNARWLCCGASSAGWLLAGLSGHC